MKSVPQIGAWLALALAVCPSAGAVAGPWVENAEARVRLVGGAPGLGLDFELQPGWHIYWKNSGDAGYAPRIDFPASSAVRDARLLFPAPRRFDLPAGMVSFGYERAVLYPIAATIVPAAGAPLEPLKLTARVDYLVCREECIPHRADLALALPVKTAAGDPESARLAAALSALPLPAGGTPEAPRVSLRVTPDVDGAWNLELLAAGGSWRAAAPDIFFESHPLFALGRPQLQASKQGLRFRIRLQRLDLTEPLPTTTNFAWTLTGFERSAAGAPAPVALAGTTPVELSR